MKSAFLEELEKLQPQSLQNTELNPEILRDESPQILLDDVDDSRSLKEDCSTEEYKGLKNLDSEVIEENDEQPIDNDSVLQEDELQPQDSGIEELNNEMLVES